jgi:hypothetical protein
MADQTAREPGLRVVGQLVGAMAVWLATFVTAARVLEDEPTSALLRGTMVAVAVLGILPAIWVLGVAIRAQDEFSRRVHLVALGVAFGATAVVIIGADFLQRAGFVDYVSLTTILFAMVLLWWLSIFVTARFYR